MTDLTITNSELLEKAQKLNKLSEVSQVALGLCLARIKETNAYQGVADSFNQYCQQELGRTKGDVSKLLKVGEFFATNGFHEETLPEVGYTKMYVALSAFPDKEPAYVIAAAKENTIHEMLENKREDDGHVHSGEFVTIHKCCGLRVN